MWKADELVTVGACVQLVMAMVALDGGRDGGGEWYACGTISGGGRMSGDAVALSTR